MHILSSKTVENGDLAQLSSRWECDATAPDGSPVHLEFRGSELARRQPDATWRLLIDNPWGAG
jgi:ketosteroid isomerase-like protein